MIKAFGGGTNTRSFTIAIMHDPLNSSGTIDNRNDNNNWTGIWKMQVDMDEWLNLNM